MVERIFSISSPEQFNTMALEVFRFQAEHCDVYAEYLRLIGADPASITRIEDIPMLPIGDRKSVV